MPTALVGQGQETRAVRQVVVGGVNVGVSSLIEKLKVARVNRLGLVSGGTDEIATADIVGPGGATVAVASEVSGLSSPRTSQAGSCERTEVSAIVTNALNNHEILVLSLNGVDLHGFEQIIGRG